MCVQKGGVKEEREEGTYYEKTICCKALNIICTVYCLYVHTHTHSLSLTHTHIQYSFRQGVVVLSAEFDLPLYFCTLRGVGLYGQLKTTLEHSMLFFSTS